MDTPWAQHLSNDIKVDHLVTLTVTLNVTFLVPKALVGYDVSPTRLLFFLLFVLFSLVRFVLFSRLDMCCSYYRNMFLLRVLSRTMSFALSVNDQSVLVKHVHVL